MQGEVDWSTWTPTMVATLVFVVRGHEVLLIRKKRGLGAGKINGPGGRVEAGESAEACAVREVQEELCVTPTGLARVGRLRFQFVDGLRLEATVFTATGCTGEPRETDEAIPLWTAIDRLPFHEMWADDALWLPLALAGGKFDGQFVFDGDEMLTSDVRVQRAG